MEDRLEFHDVANAFPLLSGAEYAAFKEDIRSNGLRESIWLHEGKIIDGRNRYNACLDVGVEPAFREWEGGSWEELVAFVVSLNIIRRHMTESERSLAAAKLKPQFEERARKRLATSTGGSSPQPVANLPQADVGKSRDKAAELLNVSPRSVQAAETVLKRGTPELVKAVEKGGTKVSAAAEVARLPKVEQARVVAEGPKAIKEKAREIREERQAVSAPPVGQGSLFESDPESDTPDEEVDRGSTPDAAEDEDSDSRRFWHQFFKKMDAFFVSIPRRGGIKRLSRHWTHEECRYAIRHLRSLSSESRKYARELRELTKSRRQPQ